MLLILAAKQYIVWNMKKDSCPLRDSLIKKTPLTPVLSISADSKGLRDRREMENGWRGVETRKVAGKGEALLFPPGWRQGEHDA
jgi:hypothetical protein